MDFKDRLKLVRNNSGLTQQDFGDKLGKSYSTIQSWERGSVTPPSKTIKRIAETFEIRKEWLENGTGEMKNTSNVQVATGNNNILNNSGSVSTAHQDHEIAEIFELLTRYASPEFRKNLRERLIKMKSDSQI
ncbi:MAG: helix-turn-helix transcriptional regulator [Deferribacterales bacterium]